ncbi:MAG: radical SAM protein, partial [Schwartzia sp.]|nr:radical SAM protein [Schwartzia sp. (in: firmicutes)]
EEIEADIKEMPKYFGAPKRIFLQGADGFAADYDVLMKTAELLHKYVPSVETIGGYARIDNFYDKTEEQLKNMAAVGYANPYIGVESGDDTVLKRINKGYTAAQAREVLEKIDASGLPFIVNFLNGAGGHGYGLANAQRTAALYDGLHPTMVNTSMLTVVPGTPLYRAVEKGLYEESTEREKLEEIHEFVRCLTNDTIFMNEHASNLFHVKCRIPEAKEELLAYIKKFMDSKDEKELRDYREMVTRAF